MEKKPSNEMKNTSWAAASNTSSNRLVKHFNGPERNEVIRGRIGLAKLGRITIGQFYFGNAPTELCC